MANLDQYGQPLRDPASAILQRKYALAQALQRQGMDTSPVVGTGNTSMQAIARVLQGGLGGLLSGQVEGEAQAASQAQKDERARTQALILGLTTGQTPGAAPAAAPDAPAAAPPMTERLGGAPPVEGPAPVPQVQQQALPAPGAPAELMPHFEEASRATGVPVPLLVAQAKQESGFRPDAVGRSGEGGVMQIMPSTARDPGFGMQGVDPATLRDPRANIMFGAQYLAARNRGTDWNDPAQRDAALGRYNGGGDPNYAANVTRNLPGSAARTGGTDMAGPGVPAAPAAAPTAPPAGGRTPDQLRTAAAQVAALGGTAAQAQALYAQADALERRQFQTETRTATDARAKVDDARADEQLKLARDAARRQEEDARLRRDSTDWIPDPAKPGALMPRPGGPQDPAVIQQRAQAATAGRPTPAAPATATAGMLENVSAVRKIDDTLAELTRRAGSGVGWSGYVPGVIHNRTDPEGVTLRALISDIGSLKLHDRSGANVTASEAPRLTPFIPSVTDDARTIRDKLTNFRREYLSALNDQYEAHGPAAGNRPIPPVEAFLQANPITPRNAEAPAGAGGAMPALPPGFTVVR